MKSAVFIDRDGVIVEDTGHIFKVEDLTFIPRSIEALKRLTDSDYKIIIVTNQAGIAKGYYTEEDYHLFTGEMLGRLADTGVRIDKVYYCPHHPKEGKGEYRIECDCRKPKTGMLERAITEESVKRAGSWLIGDKTSDIKAGSEAGIKTIMVKTGYGGSDGLFPCDPDCFAEDLFEAVDIILQAAGGLSM